MQKIDLNGKTILVTGSPGFIGANLVIRLLKELTSGTVVSLDNMNDYYDVGLKEWRLARIEETAATSPVRHVFVKGSIGSKELVESRTGIQQQNCLRVIGKVETFDRHTMIGSCCEEHTIAQLHAVVSR